LRIDDVEFEIELAKKEGSESLRVDDVEFEIELAKKEGSLQTD